MQIVGGILCVLVGMWLAQSIMGALQAQSVGRLRSERMLALLDEQIAATKALRIQREHQHHHWNGYRKFRVDQKLEEAENICSFYLVPHDGKPLPTYRPGQYLTFRINIPGEKPGELKSIVRCYSLSDAPREDHYRITVKRVPPPPESGLPAGLISNHLHDKVRVGDILDVQAPRGTFCVEPHGATPVVLIGGGVGITPILSMLNAIIHAESPRDVWLFYGVRSGRDHVMKMHLRTLAESNEQLHLHVCYSEPAPSDRLGTDYHRAGHVNVDFVREVLKVPNFDFYVCGPPPMMDSLIPALIEWGVPKDRIHMEAFGPATVTKTSTAHSAVADRDPSRKITISFSRSGKSLPWNNSYGNILDLALENGIAINAGCRAGSCGSCEVAVKQGRIVYNVEPGAEVGDGSCLTCVSSPEADLVLDA